MRMWGRQDWTQGQEARPSSRGVAFGCFAWGFIFVLGLVGAVLAVDDILGGVKLPPYSELIGDFSRMAFVVFAGGMTGMLAGRWARTRGGCAGRLIPVLTRLSWILCCAGLAMWGIAFAWTIVLVLLGDT